MIKILPHEVIEKIAAGEVVERPASVVKELIENSIDAGATRIETLTSGGGLKFIEVRDNGTGMSRQDVLLCTKPHATSKIESIKNLSRIETLGFRGEALWSISSVSKFNLVTKTKNEETAIELLVEGGKFIRTTPAASPEGTSVKVENLFFNTPARLKFLKSPKTEESHIQDVIKNFALAHPSINFRYVRNTTEIMNLPSTSVEERVKHILKKTNLIHSIYVKGDFKIESFLSPPDETKPTSSSLIIILNRRVIKDRIITGAIIASYEGMLKKGRYPEGVVYLEVPAEFVDVNVHPQKREVRFSKPNVIFEFTRRGALNFIKKSKVADRRELFFIPGAEDQPTAVAEAASIEFPASCRKEVKKTEHGELKTHHEGYFSKLRVIGQLFSTYILCEGSDFLTVIDQHASAERLTYEKLKRQLRDGSVRIQPLLLPVTISISNAEEIIIEENEGLLKSIGIDISVSGPTTAIIRGIPSIIEGRNPETVVRDVLAACSGMKGNITELIDEILATISCHSSIRGGKVLTEQEMKSLLKQLDTIDFNSYCPHGRPVYFRIPKEEFEKNLKRG